MLLIGDAYAWRMVQVGDWTYLCAVEAQHLGVRVVLYHDVEQLEKDVLPPVHNENMYRILPSEYVANVLLGEERWPNVDLHCQARGR